MAQTVHLSCLLALLVAGLAEGFNGSPGGQIQYNRSYSSPAEYAHRLDIFARNLAQAQRLQEDDLGTAEFGVSPFSDLTEEEFGQLYGHRRAAAGAPHVGRKVESEEWEKTVPQTCDWRKAAGVISSVKNQEMCNCCWAMAAAGNIEALWAITYHQSVEVSVQQLLDCDRCGNGCKGGFVWDAFLTVLNNSGLASEKDYPFRGDAKPHRCQAKKPKVAWIQDFIRLPEDEQKIAEYLATHGPITVTINMKLLQQYQKGVIKATPTTCDPQHLDHSVLLVGFGGGKSVEGRRPGAVSSQSRPRRSSSYWILKNSWGANWGEEGYFRLHRGSNTCGITKYALTALVDQPRKRRPVSCPP
ncbi:cathepsin W isoform X2 [Equus quagga]|uniref:cathepsin W isoform X2 n=1 Tax=Equus quagga TaxID=89248 RepID=UPI001EE1E495|nr:cathepsin W isoform X2 [Equus quagga]